MRIIVFIFCLILLQSSCLKQINEQPDFYYEYFPVDLGSWLEYEVVDITHTSFGSDTMKYFLKEIKANEFIDNEGEVSQRIERFWKFDISDQYVIKDVWYTKRTITTAENVEENNRYTKLIFPIKFGAYWDGNAYNSFNEWEYEYDSIHEPYMLNATLFDSTLKVIQRDNYNAVEYENCHEVYAKDVGLIYKKYIDLSINLYNILDINEGVELEMKLINFGP